MIFSKLTSNINLVVVDITIIAIFFLYQLCSLLSNKIAIDMRNDIYVIRKNHKARNVLAKLNFIVLYAYEKRFFAS